MSEIKDKITMTILVSILVILFIMTVTAPHRALIAECDAEFGHGNYTISQYHLKPAQVEVINITEPHFQTDLSGEHGWICLPKT